MKRLAMMRVKLALVLYLWTLFHIASTGKEICKCDVGKLTEWLEEVDKKQIEFLKPKESPKSDNNPASDVDFPELDLSVNMTEEEYEALYGHYNDPMTSEEEIKIDFSDIDLESSYKKWHVNITSEAETLYKENVRCRCNKTLVRLLHLHAIDGALYHKDRKKREELRGSIMTMTDNFLKAVKVPSKVCPERPVLYKLSSPLKDCQKLKCIWESWLDEVGSKVKDPFQKMVDLANEAAMEHGYKNAGVVWKIMDVEDRNADKLMKVLLNKTMPLYAQLHAYVRRKLFRFYFDDGMGACGKKPKEDGPIPIHLTGHLNGQEWKEVEDIVFPYREAPLPNVGKLLKEHSFTQLKMVQEAEKFFTSLGFRKMTDKFWEKSVFVESENNDESYGCHAAAVDRLDKNDYRIYMCANLTFSDWRTIHHEMGHIVAFMESEHLPYKFRHEVNLVFGEGLGDSMVLSVSTIKHLEQVFNRKLDPETVRRCGSGDASTTLSIPEKREINLLMRSALYWVPMFSYAYLLDAFRYQVFEGRIKPEEYNKAWWKLRLMFQGLAPQSKRPDDKFDIGSILHTAINMPTAKYFLSIFVEFQMHEALCKISGHTGPLHQCDIYGSKEAGAKLRSILQQGGSKSTVELLKELTGTQAGYSVDSVLKYYEPLYNWLVQENKGFAVGWKSQFRMN